MRNQWASFAKAAILFFYDQKIPINPENHTIQPENFQIYRICYKYTVTHKQVPTHTPTHTNTKNPQKMWTQTCFPLYAPRHLLPCISSFQANSLLFPMVPSRLKYTPESPWLGGSISPICLRQKSMRQTANFLKGAHF